MKRVVVSMVLAAGIGAGIGILAVREINSSPTPVLPAVTATPTVTPTATSTPAVTMSVDSAVYQVRSQGTKDLDTWADAALVRQFNEVCDKLDRGNSFRYIVVEMTNGPAAFTQKDAGIVIAHAVLSTCTEYTSYLSNL